MIFKSFPNYSEGDLTQLRSLIVERKNLSKISKKIGLDVYLKLGANVEKSTKILADIFESFIAALYLEKGEEFLHEFLSLTLFNRSETKDLLKDYKLNNLPCSSVQNNSSLPLEINMNKGSKISSNSMREITFKFQEDDNKKINEEQRDLLKKISSVLEGIYTFLKQLFSLKKEIINIINTFEQNQNIRHNQNKLTYDNIYIELKNNSNNIYIELKNNNNYLKELNKNTLNINNELSKFNSKLFNYASGANKIIFILTLSIVILGFILLYIILKNDILAI